ncbi:glycoside hydrolase domain-containing protein [bacterium]
MKRTLHGIITLLCFLFTAPSPLTHAEESAITAWPVSSTLKVFPDTGPPEPAGEQFIIHAVRNEYAPFQVAVRADSALKNVSVAISNFKGDSGEIPASAAPLFLVENVTIERPTIGTDHMTWPDPLPPFKPFDVEAGTTRTVWFDLFVPAGAQPGEFKAIVTLSADSGEKAIIPVTLEVAGVTLPDARTLSTAFGISYGQILKAHGMEGNDPDAQALKESYYWYLIDHRLTPYFLPVDFWSDEADRFMNDPRVTFLRAPFTRERPDMERIAARLREKRMAEQGRLLHDRRTRAQRVPENQRNRQIPALDRS